MTVSRLGGADRSRRIQIPGTTNLRDFGGFTTVDGSMLRYGLIYRAEAIVGPGASSSYSRYLTECDADYRRLNLRTVIDLRAPRETAAAPSLWPTATGARLVELPVAEGGEGADTNYIHMLLSGELDTFDPDDMGRFYIDLIEKYPDVFGEAFRVVADPCNMPSLVHCAAGKDRTGVFTALLLSALNVPSAAIVADYTLTGILRPDRYRAYADRFMAVGRNPEIARVLFETPPEAMSLALSHLGGKYGGADGYLTERCRVRQSHIDSLRRSLLS